MSKDKMKLSGVSTLIVDPDRYAVSILQQMLRGLRMDAPLVVETGEAAMEALKQRHFDLCIIESVLPDMSGPELIGWIRRQVTDIRFVPIVVLTAYSQIRNVSAARDSGAHTVVKKPISPQSLFDHIAWAANTTRPFVEIDNYVGPDRRFKFIGPPGGVGRRADDLSAEIGDATQPNLSQAEIDAMIRPTRVQTE